MTEEEKIKSRNAIYDFLITRKEEIKLNFSVDDKFRPKEYNEHLKLYNEEYIALVEVILEGLISNPKLYNKHLENAISKLHMYFYFNRILSILEDNEFKKYFE